MAPHIEKGSCFQKCCPTPSIRPLPAGLLVSTCRLACIALRMHAASPLRDGMNLELTQTTLAEVGCHVGPNAMNKAPKSLILTQPGAHRATKAPRQSDLQTFAPVHPRLTLCNDLSHFPGSPASLSGPSSALCSLYRQARLQQSACVKAGHEMKSECLYFYFL